MYKPRIRRRVDGVWEYTDDYSDEERLRDIDVASECDEGCPDSHEDPYDSTLSLAHQSGERPVEFDWLTVTIDEIMEKCAYPEHKRDVLTEVHRVGARGFLRYYKGPRPDVLPILLDGSRMVTV